MEEWAVIEEFPNFLISNKGRVKDRDTGRIKKVHISNQGYPQVSFIEGSKNSQRSIHRLMATAFVDGGGPGLIVRHIDEDKTNYSLDNLEWVTKEEHLEIARALRTGRRRKLKSWEVVDGELIEREKD